MKFIKNHIEKLLGGIFTIYSVLIYFFASDEGTRLLLRLLGKNFSPEAISSFQAKWVVWFFVGYGINALLLILAQIWTHKKISALEDIVNRQSKMLTQYELLKHNIDLIFKYHLNSIAQSLNFSNNERISLYIVDNERFVCCSRFSKSPKYMKNGRSSYPLNEGVIGKAWNNGEEFFASLPDAQRKLDLYVERTNKKYGIPEETIRKFSMFSRLFLGYRISNHDCSDHNAIIIIESTNKDFSQKGNILNVLERNRECLYGLIKDFRDFIPALARAEKEDM